MGNLKRKSNPKLESAYKEQNSCCYYCKRSVPFERITRDHIVPKSKGGKLKDNSVFSCGPCNMAKGDLDIQEFRVRTFSALKEVLQSIVDNNFIMTQSMYDKFKHYYTIFKTLSQLQINNLKPTF